MSAAPNILAFCHYRVEASDGELSAAARAHLRDAADALSMALLTLSGDDDERGDKWRRATQARGFLAEAVTALSRARIYIPNIRTHTVPVLLNGEASPDAELERLQQISTRLLWRNHAYLPVKVQAKPLPPEEEAQLAVILAGFARSNRIGRALGYKWSAVGLAIAGSSAAAGLPLVGCAVGVGAIAMATWRALRGPIERNNEQRT